MGLEGKSPDYWEEATTYLSHSDEILAEIIEEQVGVSTSIANPPREMYS